LLSYPSGRSVSTRALQLLAEALRRRRTELRTRWRRLDAGRQALLSVAHLRKGETYTDLACGFGVGVSTVYRYLREALGVLAALAPDAGGRHRRRPG
jgi:DNA invertase Pin-like site-specific DNA recombinase